MRKGVGQRSNKPLNRTGLPPFGFVFTHGFPPGLDAEKDPTDHERDRASTIVADRLCSAVANPIVRNAQEQRQLKLVGDWLDARGYRKQNHPSGQPLTDMKAATYAFRMNLAVGKALKVNIPVDVVIQPKKRRKDRLPILRTFPDTWF